ncbi:hypothetical protein ACSVC9_02105 [Clostridium sp. LBM24168]
MSRRAFKSVVICCIILILTGIVIVNASMPKFVKDRSDFSINCSFSPFDFKIETQNYFVNMNGNTIYNFKENLLGTITNVGENIRYKVDAAADSVEKTFYEIKANIGH